MTAVEAGHTQQERPVVLVHIDGAEVAVPEGATILDACRQLGREVPTLCFLPTLTPVNACRVCVVEVEGARTLMPACARPVEEGMRVATDSSRVRTSRRMVLELLASSVDLSSADADLQRWLSDYGAEPDRHGPSAPGAPAGARDARRAGHHVASDGMTAETVGQPVTIDNDLYARDYAKCILCYKCVEACGEDAQNTFAIAVAGRGFDARIATEFAVPLTDSACVYCGNCIGVCPTGALVPMTEWHLRQEDAWDPDRQTTQRTVCAFCGVGCNLDLTVQDDRIVRVDSPMDHDVTSGHLCIKGRFGFDHVHADE
jgi:NADP-reducing hydrogenase subunit HndD